MYGLLIYKCHQNLCLYKKSLIGKVITVLITNLLLLLANKSGGKKCSIILKFFTVLFILFFIYLVDDELFAQGLGHRHNQELVSASWFSLMHSPLVRSTITEVIESLGAAIFTVKRGFSCMNT